MHQGEINFEDIEFKSNFSGFKAYRQSKLGVILLTKILAEKLHELSIKVVCQHPGLVKTKLARDAGWFSKLFFELMGKSANEGAKTLKYLCDLDYEALKLGEYYKNCAVSRTTSYSYNMKIGKKLVKVLSNYLSEKLNYNTSLFN